MSNADIWANPPTVGEAAPVSTQARLLASTIGCTEVAASHVLAHPDRFVAGLVDVAEDGPPVTPGTDPAGVAYREGRRIGYRLSEDPGWFRP